jgi:3-hydroxyacyl-CoA dehydrogenase
MLKGTPLFDEFIDGDLVEAGALAFAEKVVKEKRPLKPRARPEGRATRTPTAFFQFARNTVRRHCRSPFPAPLKCARRRRGGGRPSPSTRAMRIERELLQVHLVQTPESKALRHAFFMASAPPAKIPDVPDDTPIRPIKAGRRHRRRHHGRRHRHELPQCRHPGDHRRDQAGSARPRRRRHPQELRELAKRGRLKHGRRRAAHGPAEAGTLSYEDLADADLVIEAVFEDMGVKEQVFGKLDEVDQAGRHPRHQHLDARRRRDRRTSRSVRRT